jgi:hypothetical protein
MPEALALPIRVLVKGASPVTLVSDMGGPRTDFIFPRVLEQALLAAGRPAQVCTFSVQSEPVRRSLRKWQREVLAWSPDVVVLAFGFYECVHLFLPQWLERHANSEKWRPRPLRVLYRRLLLRKIWVSLAKLQQAVDARVGARWFDRRAKLVAADLEQLILRVRTVGSPLVIVMKPLRPGARWQRWFPGMADRIDLVNREIAAVVSRMQDEDIRLFDVLDIPLIQEEGEELMPDGGHFSPQVHKMIGQALAREILDWADCQEHLKVS